MVKRVAKALVVERDAIIQRELDGERLGEDEISEMLARAAIAAMRAPNNKMLNAAAAAMSPDKRPTQRRVSVKAKHAIRYRAMIEAALATSGENETGPAQPLDSVATR
jgi:hypothetical protein